jgi:hypothetical protein
MGLDITAYGYLRPASGAELDEGGQPANWREHWLPGSSMEWSERHWPGRGEGIDPKQVYAFYRSFGFRAGSYSGYGVWRDWLAQVAGFASAEEYRAEAEPSTAFYELINFADNEGVIGPVVSTKLAKDFAENVTRAAATPAADPWFLNQYALWWTAFLTAAEGGAVSFH